MVGIRSSDQVLSSVINEIQPANIVLDCDGTLYRDIEAAREDFMSYLRPFIANRYSIPIIDSFEKIESLMTLHKTESEIAACLLDGIPEEDLNVEVIDQMNIDNLVDTRSRAWSLLSNFNIPITILTNNSSHFASRIIDSLGIHPANIIGESEANFIRKPDARIYALTEKMLGANAYPVIYFDDSPLCIEAGNKVGWIGVLTSFSSDVSWGSSTDTRTLFL